MEFRTPGGRSSASLTEKKSRFIASLSPVSSVREAGDFLSEMRAAYPGARHYVSAYRLAAGPAHCSDDGEPRGTAGVPVLSVLEKRALLNAAVVVVRYFGGILLGAPGLLRAYSRAAAMAADAVPVVVMRPYSAFEMRVSYAALGPLRRLVERCGGRVRHVWYGADVRLEGAVPEPAAPEFFRSARGCCPDSPEPKASGRLYLP